MPRQRLWRWLRMEPELCWCSLSLLLPSPILPLSHTCFLPPVDCQGAMDSALETTGPAVQIHCLKTQKPTISTRALFYQVFINRPELSAVARISRETEKMEKSGSTQPHQHKDGCYAKRGSRSCLIQKLARDHAGWQLAKYSGLLTFSLPYMTEISVVIRQWT